jgi:hypothetical protein
MCMGAGDVRGTGKHFVVDVQGKEGVLGKYTRVHSIVVAATLWDDALFFCTYNGGAMYTTQCDLLCACVYDRELKVVCSHTWGTVPESGVNFTMYVISQGLAAKPINALAAYSDIR